MKIKTIFILCTMSLTLIQNTTVFAETTPAAPPATTPTTETTPPAGDSYQTAVQNPKARHFSLEKGWFVQGGGILGYELNVFNALSAGLTTALGYQINPFVGLYARADFFSILDDSATHLGFTFIPSARFTIIENLYGFAGVGIAVLNAPKNSTIDGSPASIRRTYDHVTAEAGLGYMFFMRKNFGLFAEGGLNYNYVTKENFVQTELWRPFGRAGVSLQF